MKKFLILFFILLNLYIFPNNKPIPDTFFGLHMHKVLKRDEPWPTVPFKTWRLWDTGICWPEIQKSKDEWDFRLIDKAVKLASENNVEIVLDLLHRRMWFGKELVTTIQTR